MTTQLTRETDDEETEDSDDSETALYEALDLYRPASEQISDDEVWGEKQRTQDDCAVNFEGSQRQLRTLVLRTSEFTSTKTNLPPT